MIVATAVSLKVEVNPFRRSNGQRTQKKIKEKKRKNTCWSAGLFHGVPTSSEKIGFHLVNAILKKRKKKKTPDGKESSMVYQPIQRNLVFAAEFSGETRPGSMAFHRLLLTFQTKLGQDKQ